MKSVDLLTNAQAELEQLQPLRTRLAESLTLHVNRLQATGEPPSEELLDNLRDYRRRLVELSGCLPTGIYQGPQLDRDETTLSWESLRGALRNYQLQLKAMEVLDEIEALRHKDDSEFVPLIECQRNAARLADSIRAGSTDAETNEPLHSLNAGNHPYCMLMTLVVHGDELADEVWTEFNDQVIGAFGRPLATAVARGKIELIPIESVSPVAELDSLDPVEVSVEPEAEEASDTLQVVPDIHESEISTVQIDFQNRDVTDSPAIDDLTEQPALSRHSVELILELSACNSILSEEPQEQEAETADVSHQEVSGLFLVRPQGRQPAVDSILSDHSADSIFDSIGASATVKTPSRNYRSPEIKLLSDQPYKWSSGDVSRRSSTTTSTAPLKMSAGYLQQLARNASQADGDVRHSQLSQVVLQLLSDDRLTLAYHLTRGIETRLPGFQTNLPSWLIHSLVLSRHVCYAKGEIARKIEENLKEFSPQMLTAGDTDWNEATGFFVRAAALIPALLTSSPTASAILRTFRITPGLSHLYNYCSRLSTYGHRLQGQASDLFTPDCDMANWESEIATLQHSIETWLADSVKKACPTSRSSLLFLHAHWTLTSGSVSRYAESARLWSKWQECFRLVHRLLKPVRNAQEQERNWVKGEIDRLTQSIRLEPAGGEINQPLPLGTITFPQEAMLKVIRDGVDFASRWLRLCASKPAQGRTLASRDAEALRDEILERTDAVLLELNVFRQRHTSQRTQAAISCLESTIEHLQAIFSPHSTLALRETDPRHVVFGELLKIPNLNMNEQWMPTVDPLTLENEILSYLSADSRDWKQAFDMQCLQRDHVATDRILQLNVWRTEQERETLRRRRNSELQACRDELTRDLEDVRQMITNEAHHKRLTSGFLTGLEQRLQRVQVTLESTIDLAAVQNEVSQVRLIIERQKREALNVEKRADGSTVSGKSAVKFHQIETSESPQTEEDTWAQNIFSDN